MNMKEAAKLTGLTNDTIWYDERIGIIMPIQRKENGMRDFTDHTLNQLKFAKIIRRAGMGLKA